MMMFGKNSGKQTNQNQYSRVTTRYEMDSSDRAKCPYCGNVFGSQNDRCPNCGAGISRVGNKMIVTKTEETGTNERIAEFQHKEKMAVYEAKKRSETKELILIGILFAAAIFFFILSK